METWLNFTGVATGLVAIWYTIRESRRNNSVVLKIKECKAFSRQSVDENASEIFNEFKLVIQNCGISLHNVHASINFSHPNEPGRFNLPLKRNVRPGDRDEFAKGMVAEFGFKSYKLDKHDAAFLKILGVSENENAYLCIWSQDYLAAEFRIGGPIDRAKSRWNRLANRINNLFTHNIRRGDRTVLSTPTILPTVPVLSSNVDTFCRWLEKEKQGET